MADIYLQDYKRDCKHEAKYDAGRWVEMNQRTMNSIYNALTPESRDLYKREIAEGDVLFYPEITNKLMQMTQEQRALIETMADALLKGEKIIVEQELKAV